MANTQKIKIKLRSGATNYSGTLDAGESFYNTSTTKFYIGDGTTTIENLPYFLNKNTGVTIDTEQTISGKKVLTSDVSAKSFIKTGSSNEEILLGGGNTKSLADLSLTGHHHVITPTGSVESTFKGESSTITSTYTPSGKVDVIINSTKSNNYTPSGDVEVDSIIPEGIVTADFQGKAQSISLDYTPSGSISTPKVTVEMAQENINTISSVGASPSLYDSYEDETKTLTLSFDKGSLPTVAVKNVATEVKSTSVESLTFTGSTTQLSTSITPSGIIVNGQFNGKTITPLARFVGSEDLLTANFVGTKGNASATYTPQGKVESEFIGTENIMTSSDK